MAPEINSGKHNGIVSTVGVLALTFLPLSMPAVADTINVRQQFTGATAANGNLVQSLVSEAAVNIHNYAVLPKPVEETL